MDYMQALQDKYDALCRMLNATVACELTGDFDKREEEAQAIANLYEKRETIIFQINGFDIILNKLKSQRGKQADALDSKIKQKAAEILEIDKSRMVLYNRIMEHTKADMKKLSQGKHLSAKYDDDSYVAGYYVDKSN